MDRIDRTSAQGTRMTESGDRATGRPQQSQLRAKPRPVFWNGVGLERDCDDIVPVLWDGTCLD